MPKKSLIKKLKNKEKKDEKMLKLCIKVSFGMIPYK